MFITEKGTGYQEINQAILDHHSDDKFYYYNGDVLPTTKLEKDDEGFIIEPEWEIDPLVEELMTDDAKTEAIIKIRQYLYQKNTDGLMADYIRGEIQKEEWETAVQAIKDAWPKE